MTCVIVTGNAKSGTSMTAGALRIMGVPFGETEGAWDNQSEDLELVKRLDRQQWSKFKELAALRAKAGDTWGIKHPNLRNHLEYLRFAVKDPVFILLMRDPIANVHGQTRRCLWHQDDEAKKRAINLLAEQDKMLRWSIGKPNVLLVSYEKAVVHPIEFVSALTSFTGITPSLAQTERAESYIQAGVGYQDIKSYLAEEAA